ncbi:Unknown protein, partial [Striga hermonthica]
RPPGQGADTLGQSQIRERLWAGGGFGHGGERDDGETLGAVRFHRRQRPEEGFDYKISPNPSALDDNFLLHASSFKGFNRPRRRWDDGCVDAGDGGTYRHRMEAPVLDKLHLPVSKFRHVEASCGRNDVRRVAEDADDYHGRAAWPQEQTLGDFRRREKQRPDGGLAAAWEFHGRRAAENFSTAGDHDWRQHVTDFADSEGRETRRSQPWTAVIFGGSGFRDWRRAGDGGRDAWRGTKSDAGGAPFLGVRRCAIQSIRILKPRPTGWMTTLVEILEP